jgi:uncharacterized membrane protein
LNKHFSAKNIALGALLSASITVATMLSIPVPGFRLYFNLGEGMIYTIALMLGPRFGGICAGIGAGMGDIILGYPLWAPFTLIIKGTEGYVVGRLRSKGRKRAILCGALVMMAGYSSVAGLLYGWKAAPVELVTDVIQTGMGAAFALILVPILEKRLSSCSDFYINKGSGKA